MKFLLLFFLISLSINQNNETVNNLNSDIPSYGKLRYKYGNQTINRPQFHFTPDYGWMNDPNGCWYDKSNQYYHLYFQYNPHDTIWGMPLYWGHAYSKDLLHWTEDKIAIRPPDWAGAYSGSMYVDDQCLSGWFNNCEQDGDAKYSNAIAAFTWNLADWSEVQCLSYTTNNGSEFITDEKYCPAIANNSKQFRDPQVIKVADNTYIMSVAKSHEYSVYFYKSTNAKDFTYNGKFGLAGYLGFQYECPNLVHLKNSESVEYKDDASYWVLFISINPGSQQGGSSTEYFFGKFDPNNTENPYTLSFYYTTLLDQGKDFYAMQIIYVPPENYDGFDTAKGITWASNWQYTKEVPTDPWRSSMAIPREVKISHYVPADDSTPILHLKSKALLEDVFEVALPTEYQTMASGDKYTNEAFTQKAFGSFEFELSFKSCDAYTDHNPGVLTLYLRGGSIPEEYLRFGFHQKADAFFFDRGHSNVKFVKENPFFSDRLSMTVYGTALEETQSGYTKEGYNSDTKTYEQQSSSCSNTLYTAHAIIDRNIFEVFFNEDSEGYSFTTGTYSFFLTGGNFIDTIEVEYNLVDNQYGFREVKLRARQLNMKDETESETPEETPKEENPDENPDEETGGRRLNNEL